MSGVEGIVANCIERPKHIEETPSSIDYIVDSDEYKRRCKKLAPEHIKSGFARFVSKFMPEYKPEWLTANRTSTACAIGGVASAGLFALGYHADNTFLEWLGIGTNVMFGLGDKLDGLLAGIYGDKTLEGEIVDPLADKENTLTSMAIINTLLDWKTFAAQYLVAGIGLNGVNDTDSTFRRALKLVQEEEAKNDNHYEETGRYVINMIAEARFGNSFKERTQTLRNLYRGLKMQAKMQYDTFVDPGKSHYVPMEDIENGHKTENGAHICGKVKTVMQHVSRIGLMLGLTLNESIAKAYDMPIDNIDNAIYGTFIAMYIAAPIIGKRGTESRHKG